MHANTTDTTEYLLLRWRHHIVNSWNAQLGVLITGLHHLCIIISLLLFIVNLNSNLFLKGKEPPFIIIYIS